MNWEDYNPIIMTYQKPTDVLKVFYMCGSVKPILEQVSHDKKVIMIYLLYNIIFWLHGKDQNLIVYISQFMCER